MPLRSLPFLIREAWLNLRRHGLMTAAAICAIAVALSLVGAFAITFYEAQEATKHALSDFEMRVFLKQGVSVATGKLLQKRIAALPGVEKTDYLSSEQVFAAQAKESALDVSGIPNMMPATLNVRLSDAQKGETVAATVRSYPEVESIQQMDKEMRTLLQLSGVARTIGFAAGAILLLAALAVVANTIRVSVFTRRREIKIMQIVGASAAFIRLPLLIEGLMHGLAGGGLAALALVSTSHYIGGMIVGSLPQFTPYGAPVDFVAVVTYLLLGGAILGGLGSALSIRRYLRN